MRIKDILLLTERIVKIYLDEKAKKQIKTDENSLYRFMSLAELCQLMGFNPLAGTLLKNVYKAIQDPGTRKKKYITTTDYIEDSTMEASNLESSHIQVFGDVRNHFRRQLAISDFTKFCILNGRKNDFIDEFIAFLNRAKETVIKGTSIDPNKAVKNRNNILSSDDDILEDKIGEFDEGDEVQKWSIEPDQFNEENKATHYSVKQSNNSNNSKKSINNKFYNINIPVNEENENIFDELYSDKEEKKNIIDAFTNFMDNMRHDVINNKEIYLYIEKSANIKIEKHLKKLKIKVGEVKKYIRDFLCKDEISNLNLKGQDMIKFVENKYDEIANNGNKKELILNAKKKKYSDLIKKIYKNFINRYINDKETIKAFENEKLNVFCDLIESIIKDYNNSNDSFYINQERFETFLANNKAIRDVRNNGENTINNKQNTINNKQKELHKRQDSLLPHYEDVGIQYGSIKSFFRTLTADVAKFWDGYDCLVEFDGEKIANLVNYTNSRQGKYDKSFGLEVKRINGKLSPFHWDPALLGSTITKDGVSDNFDEYIDPNLKELWHSVENLKSKNNYHLFSKDGLKLLTMQIAYAVSNGKFHDSVHTYLNNIGNNEKENKAKTFILNQENFIKNQFEKYKNESSDTQSYRLEKNKCNPFLIAKQGDFVGEINNKKANEVYKEVLKNFIDNKITLNVIFGKFDEAETRLSLDTSRIKLQPDTIKTIWIKSIDDIKDNYIHTLDSLKEIQDFISSFKISNNSNVENSLKNASNKLLKMIKDCKENMTSAFKSLIGKSFGKEIIAEYKLR